MAELIHNPVPRTAVHGMDEIISNLWLGDILSTYNIEQLKEKRMTKVISLIDQPLPEWLRTQYQILGIRHLAFHVEDDMSEDILHLMPQVCDSIQENLSRGEGVLVHCALGMSRSGSAVIAYLMRTQKNDRDKVLAFVKQRRPRVRPNEGFWEQLEIWETCKYEIWEEVDGLRQEKAVYNHWKERAEEEMKERVREIRESGTH